MRRTRTAQSPSDLDKKTGSLTSTTHLTEPGGATPAQPTVSGLLKEPRSASPAQILQLKQSHGNRAVQRLIQRGHNQVQRGPLSNVIQRTIWNWNGSDWTTTDSNADQQKKPWGSTSLEVGTQYNDETGRYNYPGPTQSGPTSNPGGHSTAQPNASSLAKPSPMKKFGMGLTINIPKNEFKPPPILQSVRLYKGVPPLMEDMYGMVTSMRVETDSADKAGLDKLQIMERLETVTETGCFKGLSSKAKIQQIPIFPQGGTFDDHHQLGKAILDKGRVGRCVIKQVHTYKAPDGQELVIPNSGFLIFHTILGKVGANGQIEKLLLITRKFGQDATVGQWTAQAGLGDKTVEQLYVLNQNKD